MGILDKLFGSSGNSEEDRIALFVNLLTSLSAADGNISDEEGKYVSDYINSNVENISKEKWDRILAKSESIGTNAMEMASKLDRHDKVELVKELIGLAASDGHFHGAELAWIMVFSGTIGLDPKKIQKEIEGSHEIDWNEANESMRNFAKELEDKTGVKIDGVDELDVKEESNDSDLTEKNIMYDEYLNNEFKDYFNFNKIIEEMINILGLEVYQTIAKNAGFVIKQGLDDEIDENSPCTEEQLRKNFLQINNIIIKSSVLVAVTEKIEPSELIDFLIFNNENEELSNKIKNTDLDPVSRVNLQLLIVHLDPHETNNHIYDIFDEGMIDKGLLNSSRSIFVLFLEGSNRPTDQKLKDNVAGFLDTFGYGLFLKEEFKSAVIIHNKSIELSPDHRSVAEHITNKGKALLKLGNVEDAKKDFEKALEKDEKFEEAKKLIAEIKTLPQSRLMTGKGIDNSNIFDL